MLRHILFVLLESNYSSNAELTAEQSVNPGIGEADRDGHRVHRDVDLHRRFRPYRLSPDHEPMLVLGLGKKLSKISRL